MDNIVAYSLEKLYMELINIDQNFLDSDLKGMDAYEKDLATAFRRAVADHMQSCIAALMMLCVRISAEMVGILFSVTIHVSCSR